MVQLTKAWLCAADLVVVLRVTAGDVLAEFGLSGLFECSDEKINAVVKVVVQFLDSASSSISTTSQFMRSHQLDRTVGTISQN